MRPIPFLLLLAHASFALQAQELVVGEPWEFAVKKGFEVVDAGGEALPSWVSVQSTAIRGVPHRADIGRHYLKISIPKEKDSVLEVRVREDVKNPCGNDSDTFWMDVEFGEKATVDAQIEAVDKVAKLTEISRSSLRVLPRGEADRVWEEKDEKAQFSVSATFCSFDDAMEAMGDVVSAGDAFNGLGVHIEKGRVLSRQQRNEGVESAMGGWATGEPWAPEAFTSTARAIRSSTSKRRANNEPVRLNSLSSLQCTRGSLCELDIPKNTFVDAEDGDTTALTLSVHPNDKWVFVDRLRLKALPLEEGEFEFRLEARDTEGLVSSYRSRYSLQMASAPFRLHVSQSSPVNHAFVLTLNKPSMRLLEQPSTLYRMVERLSSYLKDPSSSVSIREVLSNGTHHTLVSWSNSSLSSKVCEKEAIEAIRQKMMTKKQKRVLTEFVRAMNEEYIVSGVQLQLKAPCDDTSKQPGTTESSPTAEEASDEAGFPLLPLLLAALFLLAIALLVLLCCFISRRKTSKEKRNRSVDFETKGKPVVFPEELGDEETTATTPMIVREERPPLRLTQVDNPLYKPPPPLSHASSPRTVASPSTQRLPPPYVPP